MAQRIVNEFSVRVATKNGTGSQSSNNIIFRTLFRMGVGVNGKNLFPSNIQGLPTWFLIRASKKGYRAPVERHQVHVLMNDATVNQDFDAIHEGDAVIYNSDLKNIKPELLARKGVHFYPVPFDQLSKTGIADAKLRPLLKNMLYVGVFAELFGLDKDLVKQAVSENFKGKEKVVQLNTDTVWIGVKYAQENLKKSDSFFYEKDKHNKGCMMIEGNQSAAMGALFAGVTFVSWYPITPSSSSMEALIEYLEKAQKDSNGKRKFAVVQAEDELASIAMAIGAGWAGARSITATSGPGISLMAENYGYGYYTEIPTVIIDIQRVGPSTGLPTRTQQGDLKLVAFLSHGDTRQIMFFPATPREAFEMTYKSFNVAERMQQPVFVMSDLDLGMNLWVSEPFEYPTEAYDRGKVLNTETFKKVAKFERYGDPDGDGIPYRTLPGESAEGASYFTRGSGHGANARYSEDPDVYTKNMDRLAKKSETVKKYLPEPEFLGDKAAKVGIIALGTSHSPVLEAMDTLAEKGLKLKYCRPKSFPFHSSVHDFIKSCDRVFVIDQNRDAQLYTLLGASFRGVDVKLESIRYYGGLPLAAARIVNGILNYGSTQTFAEKGAAHA